MGKVSSKKEKPAPYLKIATLGQFQAGKTSLVHRLKHGVLPTSPDITYDIDCENFNLDGTLLQAWDYTGRGDYHFMARLYYRDAAGIVFMVDSSSPELFEDSMYYLNEVLEDENTSKITIMVVANKQDLEGAVGPEVLEEKIKEECKIKKGISLFVMPMSVTADDDHSIQLAYRLFVKTMKKKRLGKVPTGLIPKAWETAEKELENDKELDDAGKEKDLAFISDKKKKSLFKDPVHALKSFLIH